MVLAQAIILPPILAGSHCLSHDANHKMTTWLKRHRQHSPTLANSARYITMRDRQCRWLKSGHECGRWSAACLRSTASHVPALRDTKRYEASTARTSCKPNHSPQPLDNALISRSKV